MKLGNYTVEDIKSICKEYYPKDKYEHVLRVEEALNFDMIPEYLHDACRIIALMHDLLEDTDFNWPGIWPWDIVDAVESLTHNKNYDTYKQYIKIIRENCATRQDIDQCVWWVKLADMKDHLSQTETLTLKLKEKYLEGLAELL